jgi:hypothetical protein
LPSSRFRFACGCRWLICCGRQDTEPVVDGATIRQAEAVPRALALVARHACGVLHIIAPPAACTRCASSENLRARVRVRGRSLAPPRLPPPMAAPMLADWSRRTESGVIRETMPQPGLPICLPQRQLLAPSLAPSAACPGGCLPTCAASGCGAGHRIRGRWCDHAHATCQGGSEGAGRGGGARAGGCSSTTLAFPIRVRIPVGPSSSREKFSFFVFVSSPPRSLSCRGRWLCGADRPDRSQGTSAQPSKATRDPVCVPLRLPAQRIRCRSRDHGNASSSREHDHVELGATSLSLSHRARACTSTLVLACGRAWAASGCGAEHRMRARSSDHAHGRAMSADPWSRGTCPDMAWLSRWHFFPPAVVVLPDKLLCPPAAAVGPSEHRIRCRWRDHATAHRWLAYAPDHMAARISPDSCGACAVGTDACQRVAAHCIRGDPRGHAANPLGPATRPPHSCPSGRCLPHSPRLLLRLLASAAVCAHALYPDTVLHTESEVVGATMRMRAGQAAEQEDEACMASRSHPDSHRRLLAPLPLEKESMYIVFLFCHLARESRGGNESAGCAFSNCRDRAAPGAVRLRARAPPSQRR